jgi:hypothetical protein
LELGGVDSYVLCCGWFRTLCPIDGKKAGSVPALRTYPNSGISVRRGKTKLGG